MSNKLPSDKLSSSLFEYGLNGKIKGFNKTINKYLTIAEGNFCGI